MKYKKLHELSDAEYQVLRNIATRNLFDIMDVQIAYVRWSRDQEVNKAIEKEFEMAFLGDFKDTLKEKLQMLSADLAQNGLPADIKESFITCNFSKSLQNTPKVLHKPKRDLVINADDIMNLKIELNRADFSYDKFLERI